MATKRNPLSIQYEKAALQARKDLKQITEFNYMVPSTHARIKVFIDLVKINLAECTKILKEIEKEKK
jgi:hypothetical protein